MKTKLLFLLISAFTFNNFAQIKFEKGYFIDNEGVKTECLIKNIDWFNNPLEFDFKIDESSSSETKTIKTINEFAVSHIKYTRFIVDIDRSSEKTNELSIDRNPIFQEETLFLKSLIEGDSNLYFYKDGPINRYFYGIPNTKEVKQLVYKNYLAKNDKIKENNRYKQQLLNDLECASISKKDIERLNYKKKTLVGFFAKYNDCKNSNIVTYEKTTNDDLFNLNIRPGISSSSLSITNGILSSKNEKFENQFNFRIGIEAEFILSFNKNKWAIIVEPTYQSYNIEKEDNSLVPGVDYKSIEIPIGVRHYFFLDKSSKIFANALFVYDFPLESSIGILEITSSPNAALGIGYNFNKKYSFELRYFTNRNVLGEYLTYGSKYKTLSFIVGYNLF